MRPKFTHDLAGTSGPPEWISNEDSDLVVERSDGQTERWHHYLERDPESGQLWPALPPAARREENTVREAAQSEASSDE